MLYLWRSIGGYNPPKEKDSSFVCGCLVLKDRQQFSVFMWWRREYKMSTTCWCLFVSTVNVLTISSVSSSTFEVFSYKTGAIGMPLIRRARNEAHRAAFFNVLCSMVASMMTLDCFSKIKQQLQHRIKKRKQTRSLATSDIHSQWGS